MTREQKLEARASEVREELKKWATENGVLDPNEELWVSLKLGVKVIRKKPNVAHLGKGKKPVRIERELTEEDWQKILSLPWTPVKKRQMEWVMESNNEPIRVGAHQRVRPGELEPLNAFLIGNGSPYRFLRIPCRNDPWLEGYPRKLYPIEPVV